MMYASGNGSEGTFRRAQPDDQQFFKAFTEGVVGFNRRMSRMTIKGKRTFYPVRPEASNRTRNQFFYAMHLMTAGRVLFVTEQGRMGVGPKDTAVGDRVAVLAGSTVPFLLRDAPKLRCLGGFFEVLLPRERTEQSKPEICHEVHQDHNVVGDAYVAGIMDSQVVKVQVSEIYLQ